MKTDELIRVLVEDTKLNMRLGRLLTFALIASIVVSLIILLSTVGVRNNIADAISTPRVQFKMGVTLALAFPVTFLLFSVGRPGVSLKSWALLLLFPLVLAIVGVTVELSVVSRENWKAHMIGNNAGYCLLFVPMLALAPLTAFLSVLRHGAPDSPGMAGAAAGLAAGAIGCSVYAWHCPDDSPLFVVTWYSLAIVLVTTVGFFVGRRRLQW